VTDCNVMLGKLNPAHFPPSSARTPTSRSTPTSCAERFAALGREIGDGRSPEEVAEGFLRIAVDNMANAIKKISRPARL
jgi:5-oxoprolinase (ATP-hydrolysing)